MSEDLDVKVGAKSSDFDFCWSFFSVCRPGWTYRGEGKSFEKTPSIAKIIEREKMRKFSPAGMCE